MWIPYLQGHANLRAPALDCSYESQERMQGMVCFGLIATFMHGIGKDCFFNLTFEYDCY